MKALWLRNTTSRSWNKQSIPQTDTVVAEDARAQRERESESRTMTTRFGRSSPCQGPNRHLNLPEATLHMLEVNRNEDTNAIRVWSQFTTSNLKLHGQLNIQRLHASE